jgi:hypothetical protein
MTNVTKHADAELLPAKDTYQAVDVGSRAASWRSCLGACRVEELRQGGVRRVRVGRSCGAVGETAQSERGQDQKGAESRHCCSECAHPTDRIAP